MNLLREYFQLNYFIYLLLSLIVGFALYYFLAKDNLPYEFNILAHHGTENRSEHRLYHDFNNDGYSESIELVSPYSSKRSYLVIYDFSGGIVDQARYDDKVNIFQGLWFEDTNGDDYDEILALTLCNDSLFLYVHDIKRKQVELNRAFLLNYVHHEGTFYLSLDILERVSDVNSSNNLFVFTFATGGNKNPRGVYIFDTQKRRVVNSFKSAAMIYQTQLYDYTGDGSSEIILTCTAFGNFHTPETYSDQFCWLFVLDQQLKPVIKPLKIGQYPSTLRSVPITIKGEKCLLLNYHYNGELNLTDELIVLNSDGKKVKHFAANFMNRFNEKPLVDHNKNPTNIYFWHEQDQLITLNENLEITQKSVAPFDNTTPRKLADLNDDGIKELFCLSDDHILIYTTEFELLAKLPVISPKGRKITFRRMGKGNAPEIGIIGGGDFYRLSLVKNVFHSYIPLLSVMVCLSIFLLSIFIERSLSSFAILFKMNRYENNNPSIAKLILDKDGTILNATAGVSKLLQLMHSKLKGKNYRHAFERKQKFIEVIDRVLKDGLSIEKESMVDEIGQERQIEYSITPLRYFFNSTIVYLISFSPKVNTDLSQKLQIWSKSVQKMAHDIKTPLSSIRGNLFALQKRLNDVLGNDHNTIFQELNFIRGNVDAVLNITRDFLKYIDLEKPELRIVDLKNIIEVSQSKFADRVNNDLQILLNIEENLPNILADSRQIEMVMQIILENALEALDKSSKPGIVQIDVQLAQDLTNQFSAVIAVEVIDNGPGIDPTTLLQIFDPKFSTKKNGSGIGLVIAKKIIEDHHGEISVHSEHQNGCTVRFSLPIYQVISS